MLLAPLIEFRSGDALLIALSLVLFFGSLWMFRDIVRVARSPEPRLQVSADGVRCSFGFLGAATVLRPADIRVVKVFSSRATVTVFAKNGKRLPIAWRWVRLDGGVALSALEAGREMCRLLGVPGVEVQGFFL